ASPMRSSTWPTRPSGITIGSDASVAPKMSWYHARAARASLTARYGVTVRRGGRVAGSVVVVDMAPPGGSGPSSRSRRARRWAVNSGRGATGWSARRRSSIGSGVIAGSFVGAAEGDAGPHEEGLGGVDPPAEVVGHLGDREAVEVAQRERGAMVGTEVG